MKKTNFAALACLLIAAAGVALAQQPAGAAGAAAIPDGKVVVINTNLFPTEIGELKQKYEQVQGQFKAQQQRIESLRQQVSTKESELQTKGPSMTADKQRELQLEIEQLKKQGTREVEDLQQDYNKALDTTTKPVRDKLYQFMQNYALQRSIIMIIDLPGMAQSGGLAFWNPATDITQDLIREYNKANPVPTAPAPSAQPPAQRPGTPAKPSGNN
jgi:Skp family chaperone for outer membrane proteins